MSWDHASDALARLADPGRTVEPCEYHGRHERHPCLVNGLPLVPASRAIIERRLEEDAWLAEQRALCAIPSDNLPREARLDRVLDGVVAIFRGLVHVFRCDGEGWALVLALIVLAFVAALVTA